MAQIKVTWPSRAATVVWIVLNEVIMTRVWLGVRHGNTGQILFKATLNDQEEESSNRKASVLKFPESSVTRLIAT